MKHCDHFPYSGAAAHCFLLNMCRLSLTLIFTLHGTQRIKTQLLCLLLLLEMNTNILLIVNQGFAGSDDLCGQLQVLRNPYSAQRLFINNKLSVCPLCSKTGSQVSRHQWSASMKDRQNSKGTDRTSSVDSETSSDYRIPPPQVGRRQTGRETTTLLWFSFCLKQFKHYHWRYSVCFLLRWTLQQNDEFNFDYICKIQHHCIEKLQ